MGFFSIGMLYRKRGDTVQAFWDVLCFDNSGDAWAAGQAGLPLSAVRSLLRLKPCWKWPWAAAQPEFSPQGGLSVASVPACKCGEREG